MKSNTTKHLYWVLVNKYDDYELALCGEDTEGPTYGTCSLEYYYGIYSTYDKNLIFEAVFNDFKMSDKDKPHLWKLLNDFSIEKFLNTKQDPEFLGFLQKYDFRICVCVNNFYL